MAQHYPGPDFGTPAQKIAPPPDRLRGVAVVEPTIADTELAAMARGGMRSVCSA
jgi:hypothetical protein